MNYGRRHEAVAGGAARAGGERVGVAAHLVATCSVLIACVLLSSSANAQEPADPRSGRGSVLDVGLGLCAPAIYDEAFSLVTHSGLGPSLFLRYSNSRTTSTHVVESHSCVSRLRSDVPNQSYELSSANVQERLAYKYLRRYTIGDVLVSTGPSVVVDFSKLSPEGLVVNNAPLHDLNIQLQMSAGAAYQGEVLKKHVRLSYQLDVAVAGYNSRPDYLGFTEFSGKSKYFNDSGSWSLAGRNYFYARHGIQLELSPDNTNHVSIHLGQNFARNNVSKPYRNLSGSVFVAYSRRFGRG